MEAQDQNQQTRLDIAAVRAKLAGKSGQTYWRALEEVADTPEFQTFLEDEFPNRSTLMQINRRDLLKFMGASMALAGLTGCRSVFLPEDKVVPYVRQPEELVPGKPLFYSSGITLAGYATGILVEQREGRPVKLEGNPQHPASRGALDAISQAQLLSLYDPDRATAPTIFGDYATWPSYQLAIREAATANGGKGFAILTGATTSPTFARLLDKFLAKFPSAKWYVHEPYGRENVHQGAALAYGKPYNPVYNFKGAKIVVTLDGDFLDPVEFPGSLAYARDFADGRRVTGTTGTMNRLYAYESTPGLAGIVGDHRWPVKPSEIDGITRALAAAVGVPGVSGSSRPEIAAIAKDLLANRGASVVVAGPSQPPQVHALALAINQALGNIGTTVTLTDPVEYRAAGRANNISDLTSDLNTGAITKVLVIDSNPVYTAPADLNFSEAFKKAKLRVHASLIQDETSALSEWHLPLSHELESWGDARAFDGTITLIQPIIAPLHSSRSAIELLSDLVSETVSSYELVRTTFKDKLGSNFEVAWRKAVHDGCVEGSALPRINPAPLPLSLPEGPTVSGLEVSFKADPSIYDGRFANNGWLQELPKPVTKLTWDNAILLAPKTAEKLGVSTYDLVRVKVGTAVAVGPVFVQPGQAEDVATIHLGYGRTAGGTLASIADPDGTPRDSQLLDLNGGGFNAFALRTRDGAAFVGGAQLTKTGGVRKLASTQAHSPLGNDRINDHRDVLREGTLAGFLVDDKKALVPEHAPESEWIKKQNLYPEEIFPEDGPQWGMTIDMNTCIGCNACITACQAENNISVVGKEQVMRNREMHWLRIDRYYKGDSDNPTAIWQPVACVHCEKAPCEPVCPVAATVHSHEGLNQMVYNRCVGTRYCSNNCPYKVRKFNYLNYSDNQPNFSERSGQKLLNQNTLPGPINAPKKTGVALLRMLNNPDVTVRGRGVMEKCTYCVQRINDARIESKKAGREIAEGEILTACQQACPTQTIVFGDVNSETSKVSRLRKDPRSYLLLEELQTRPRTSHLAKLRNPNPELVKA